MEEASGSSGVLKLYTFNIMTGYLAERLLQQPRISTTLPIGLSSRVALHFILSTLTLIAEDRDKCTRPG